ncbi:MAG: branched-chain amino acid ABC transporter permease [Salinisphaera sp.]|jgi:branched-chain amino acid transport system permease protein|nr:branched-chain amino acid ABC transporter permease [Salinisphaera sp.]
MNIAYAYWRTGLALLALIVTACLPAVTSSYYLLGVLTTAFYLAVYAMSWDLLFGYAGEVNFGPTFLIGLSAYAAGLCNTFLGWPVWVCIPIGTAAAMLGGLALVGPALRLKGPYFGLVTLVAVLLLGHAITIFSGYTGGEIGLALRDILTLSSTGNFYYALGLMAITAVVLRIVVRSPLGLILEASGQDSVATEALGFSVIKFKVLAFMLSALFSGLAGAMTVFYFGTASPGTVVVVAVTVQIIIATIIGGRRSIIGSILGAVFLVVAGEFLRPLGELSTTAVSILALLVLVFAPNGFISVFGRRGAR